MRLGIWEGVAWVLGGFLLCGAVIVGLSKVFAPKELQAHRIEREFRQACANVGGTTVWNRSNWVCLK